MDTRSSRAARPNPSGQQAKSPISGTSPKSPSVGARRSIFEPGALRCSRKHCPFSQLSHSACLFALPAAARVSRAFRARRLSPNLRPAARRAAKSHTSIVIIQENHSFESFFAGYPGANAPMSGCASPAPGGNPHRMTTTSGCPAGDTLVPLYSVPFQKSPDLKHDWGSSMIDWNGGQMDGFSHWGADRARTRPTPTSSTAKRSRIGRWRSSTSSPTKCFRRSSAAASPRT